MTDKIAAKNQDKYKFSLQALKCVNLLFLQTTELIV